MSEEKKNEILDQAKALDDQELSDIAGGKKCLCAIGGGGEASEGEKTCVCVVGGGGEFNSLGEKELYEKERCTCVVGGAGEDYESKKFRQMVCGCEGGGHGYV